MIQIGDMENGIKEIIDRAKRVYRPEREHS